MELYLERGEGGVPDIEHTSLLPLPFAWWWNITDSDFGRRDTSLRLVVGGKEEKKSLHGLEGEMVMSA